MKEIIKALCIVLGITSMTLGLVATLFFIVVANMSVSMKAASLAVSLLAVWFGWWLTRRGSNSVRDALGWIIFYLIP
mgnify:CR=1 FL=1